MFVDYVFTQEAQQKVADAGTVPVRRDVIMPDKYNLPLPDEAMRKVPEAKRTPLLELLAQDPRPGYHDDPERIYGFGYAGLEIRFSVCQDELTVTEIEEMSEHGGETHGDAGTA